MVRCGRAPRKNHLHSDEGSRAAVCVRDGELQALADPAGARVEAADAPVVIGRDVQALVGGELADAEQGLPAQGLPPAGCSARLM